MACPNSARKLSKTIGFRCSPQQNDLITHLAEACGMNKQDYILAKLTDTEIVVTSSPRTRKAMREWIENLTEELRSTPRNEPLSDSLQEQLTVVLKYFNDLCAAEEAELRAESRTSPAPSVPQTKTAPAMPDESRIFNMDRG